MITDDNKWTFIEAFLAGKLDASAQELVRRKMDEDPVFRTDVLIQQALNREIEAQQQAEERDLVAKFMANRPKPGIVRPLPVPIPIWRQTWVRAAAVIALVMGLGWVFFYNRQPETLAVQIVYDQRGLGMAGDSASQQTTFPVEFNSRGPAGGEYSSGANGIRLYFPDLPANAKQWTLRDDPQQGGYLLKTPEGPTYQLDKDTFGARKPLQPVN
ncbi:hypothetical protein GCM10028803_59880 [Larkinella knui]|uniref:Uncharacterized protein n=1 Tax=Larkinella knui TaxID=2025310 RepID=A0A3P1CAI0_9BACT|nr:hypothetical protein [Larkinella knui]RRB10331.1 hypothetical protein EHT87_29330 [Larkinella knui]